jgi:hypothetical protein
MVISGAISAVESLPSVTTNKKVAIRSIMMLRLSVVLMARRGLLSVSGFATSRFSRNGLGLQRDRASEMARALIGGRAS